LYKLEVFNFKLFEKVENLIRRSNVLLAYKH
jgi:hypothetical protein